MDSVLAGTTSKITATFKDETGAAVTVVNAMTLTIYERDSLAIVNTKNGTDISASFSAGTLTLTLTAADNAMVTTEESEIHIILIEWTYGGTKKGKKEIPILVYLVDKAH
jgi:hypothetical protein